MNTSVLKTIKERYGVELVKTDLQKICIGINCGMCFYMTNPNDLSEPTVKVIVKYSDNLFKLITYRDGTVVNALPFSNSKRADILNIPDLNKEINLLSKKELKRLSHICAYCNRALKDNEKTIDHILPRCAEGENVIENFVVCCSECNSKKADYDINSYLERNDEIAYCFENYLEMIDNQRGDKEYSRGIKRYIKSHLLSKAKKYPSKRYYRYFEVQDIEYEIKEAGIKFCLNKTESRILDYFLADKDFTDHKALARELKISQKELLAHITHINCLTGVLVLKQVKANGVRVNPLYKQNLDIRRV